MDYVAGDDHGHLIGAIAGGHEREDTAHEAVDKDLCHVVDADRKHQLVAGIFP